ncbi:LppX_LprAFG lipoprotein [Glycomyces paridis]|uniref:LppX_LprAFG lipoprotein n=1 Tax=Glycomyces paridis TaxID=2126555 RepID=A0A4S8PCW4_9ACTN|nr:LppX_LprAFG lipoprotein [Glycomyces paridis]THV27621.1 LppX_LprAFG lipoprotein [Glycomyces paridis]
MRPVPLALSGLALVLLTAACTGEESPPADDVIPAAAAAMAEVESVRFDLTVDGSVEGLSVKAADGVVTADGSAEGTGTITAFGVDVEVEYVIIGEDAYVKGFTGGFQQIPVGDDMLPYDPTILLAPTGASPRSWRPSTRPSPRRPRRSTASTPTGTRSCSTRPCSASSFRPKGTGTPRPSGSTRRPPASSRPSSAKGTRPWRCTCPTTTNR